MASEKYSHQQKLRNAGYNFERIAEKVAGIYHIAPAELFNKGRQKQKAEARGLLCFWAVREMGLSLRYVSERLGMSSLGVSYSVCRGEKTAPDRIVN